MGWKDVHFQLSEAPFCDVQKQIVRVSWCRNCNICGLEGLCKLFLYLEGKNIKSLILSASTLYSAELFELCGETWETGKHASLNQINEKSKKALKCCWLLLCRLSSLRNTKSSLINNQHAGDWLLCRLSSLQFYC